jgi:hypothetical protein
MKIEVAIKNGDSSKQGDNLFSERVKQSFNLKNII